MDLPSLRSNSLMLFDLFLVVFFLWWWRGCAEIWKYVYISPICKDNKIWEYYLSNTNLSRKIFLQKNHHFLVREFPKSVIRRCFILENNNPRKRTAQFLCKDLNHLSTFLKTPTLWVHKIGVYKAVNLLHQFDGCEGFSFYVF